MTAPRKLKRSADNWYARSNAAINTSATSLVLKSSGASGLEAPCVIHESGKAEKLLVTDIATDTPSAGLDTLTVSRGFGGSTAVSHASDALFMQWFYKEYPNELATKLEHCMMVIGAMKALQSGIIQTASPSTDLEVTAESTPSMTVEIATGGCVIAGEPSGLIAGTTLTFTAPATNPRIDVVEIDRDGVVSAVTGTEAASPSAPAVTSGSLKLAEIYHTTAETSIKDADDATNGYITDARVFV